MPYPLTNPDNLSTPLPLLHHIFWLIWNTYPQPPFSSPFPHLLFSPSSQALTKALNTRGGISAELATKISLGSLSVYAAEMWFSDYANKKYSADKSALSPNGTWWVRWFQLSLVQQVSIFAFCLAGGGDLTALCKVSFLPAQPCPVRPPVTPHPP
jgi:hypothetical protein